MKTLLIIDTFNLLFRSYYAMRSFKSPEGLPNGMLLGLANKLLELASSDYDGVVFATDCGKSFRNDLLPEYKANRKELEPELKAQIPLALNMLASAGYALIERENYEADDIIASLAKSASSAGYTQVFIYSTDKDLYSLINEHTSILGKDLELINKDQCLEKFGVLPSQIRDYLALIGDSADNFKGVAGVGPAAAKRLLAEFKDIEGIYANIHKAGSKGLIAKLQAGKESALLCQKIATLEDGLDMNFAFSKAQGDWAANYASLASSFAEYGLFKHAKQAKQFATQAPEASLSQFKQAPEASVNQFKQAPEASLNQFKHELFKPYLITDAQELFSIINSLPERVGFDTETTGLQKNARCVGFSFAAFFGDELRAFYVPIAHVGAKNIDHTSALKAISLLFEHTIIGHNLIFDFRVIEHNFKIKTPAKFIDSMILAWLANSDQKVGLDALSLKLFNHQNISFSSLVPKGSHFGELNVQDAYIYAAEDAAMSLKIACYYEQRLDILQLRWADAEMRFLKVLFKMSQRGIMLSKLKLSALADKLQAYLEQKEQEVKSLAGSEFNLASPKQLAAVLYDELSLTAPKSRSTAEDVIKKLDHPIIAPLLEWRSAFKVLSTYVKPLLELSGRASDEFCINAQFMQTGTATGRISCQNPNLQNIPARSIWAKELKSAFIARDGFSFISLDYSQIELRMLAHFSGDEALCAAFKNNLDIHAITAKECFNDESKRQLAKAINFGLIYGMGARSLGEDLNISAKEAKAYIDAYFAKFPSVRQFFDRCRLQAREQGYISTLANRRRYFVYGNSAREDAAHDRECINSLLQGSAADLIKTAMIKAQEFCSDDAALILQVHDELIYEVRDELVEEFSPRIQAIMQNAAALKVPLLTSISVGKNLAELK